MFKISGQYGELIVSVEVPEGTIISPEILGDFYLCELEKRNSLLSKLETRMYYTDFVAENWSVKITYFTPLMPSVQEVKDAFSKVSGIMLDDSLDTSDPFAVSVAELIRTNIKIQEQLEKIKDEREDLTLNQIDGFIRVCKSMSKEIINNINYQNSRLQKLKKLMKEEPKT